MADRVDEMARQIAERCVERPYNRGTVEKAAAVIATALRGQRRAAIVECAGTIAAVIRDAGFIADPTARETAHRMLRHAQDGIGALAQGGGR